MLVLLRVIFVIVGVAALCAVGISVAAVVMYCKGRSPAVVNNASDFQNFKSAEGHASSIQNPSEVRVSTYVCGILVLCGVCFNMF